MGGADDLRGEAGNDTINGGDGADVIRGGDDNDTIDGGWHNDIIYGDDGADTLDGGEGLDTLYGGNGDDILNGGVPNPSTADANNLHGGAGNDTYRIWNNTLDSVYETAGGGTDTLDFSNLNVSSTGITIDLTAAGSSVYNLGPVSVGFSEDLETIENVVGTAFADSITGSDANNVLTGGAGNDTISGGLGNDTIYGDAGFDLLYGDRPSDPNQGGEDTIHGGADNDTIYGGWENDHLHGDDGNDLLDGGEGWDYLYGDNGNDTLDPGEPDSDSEYDRLFGGQGDDVYRVWYTSWTMIHEEADSGNDTVDFSGLDIGFGVTLDLQSTANSYDVVADPGAAVNVVFMRDLTTLENIIGTDYGDEFYGNDNENIIYGLDGDDYIDVDDTSADEAHGGPGSDTIISDLLDTVT